MHCVSLGNFFLDFRTVEVSKLRCFIPQSPLHTMSREKVQEPVAAAPEAEAAGKDTKQVKKRKKNAPDRPQPGRLATFCVERY